MVGVLAANQDASRIGALVLVGPSPRYVNDGAYVGGFEQADIDGLIDSLDANYLGWSQAMAPVIMGNPDRPELGDELTEMFCTCRSGDRPAVRPRHLPLRQPPRSRRGVGPTLVLQNSDDVIAPDEVGRSCTSRSPAARWSRCGRPATCPTCRVRQSWPPPSALPRMTDADRDLFDRAPFGYLTTTSDGVITQVNDTLLAWLGRDRDAVAGAPFSSLLERGQPPVLGDPASVGAAAARRGSARSRSH